MFRPIGDSTWIWKLLPSKRRMGCDSLRAPHVWQTEAAARTTQTFLPLVQRGDVPWQEVTGGESPGGPVFRTRRFHFRGPGFDPWSGN